MVTPLLCLGCQAEIISNKGKEVSEPQRFCGDDCTWNYLLSIRTSTRARPSDYISTGGGGGGFAAAAPPPPALLKQQSTNTNHGKDDMEDVEEEEEEGDEEDEEDDDISFSLHPVSAALRRKQQREQQQRQRIGSSTSSSSSLLSSSISLDTITAQQPPRLLTSALEQDAGRLMGLVSAYSTHIPAQLANINTWLAHIDAAVERARRINKVFTLFTPVLSSRIKAEAAASKLDAAAAAAAVSKENISSDNNDHHHEKMEDIQPEVEKEMELDRPEEENEVDEEQTIVISKNGKIAPYCLYDSRICGEWYQQFIVNDGSNSSTPSSSLSAVSVALQHLDSLMKLHPEYTVSDLVKQPETEGKETKEDEEEAKSITSEQFQVSKMTAIDAITTSHTSDPATSSPSPPALAPPPTVKKLSLHLLRLISSPHLCKQQGKCTNHNEWQSIRVWDAEIQGMNKIKEYQRTLRRFNETRNRIQTRLELLNTGRQDSYKDAWTSDDDDDGVLDVDGSSLNDLDSAALSSKKRKGPGFVYF